MKSAVHIEVIRRRLAGQRLTGKAFGSVADALRSLVAVQSQDYTGAQWALGQRVTGATEAALERDFAEGRILRTHVMRPTWHFVAPDDLRWLLALTGDRVKKRMAPYDKKLGLDAGIFRKSEKAISRALEGGQHLTRSELGKVVGRAKFGAGPAATQRLAHIMMNAELNALICSGPRIGKQFTYALVEERVPTVPALERDEALTLLATRYFTTRGPATAQDFSWWSGLTMADCRRAIHLAGNKVQQDHSGGRAVFFGTLSSQLSPLRSHSAHLLPNYDEYFIGHKDRSAIGHRIRDLGRVTGGNALIANVVSIDGELVGGWKRVQTAKGTLVRLELVVPITSAERRLINREVARLGQFLDTPIRTE